MSHRRHGEAPIQAYDLEEHDEGASGLAPGATASRRRVDAEGDLGVGSALLRCEGL